MRSLHLDTSGLSFVWFRSKVEQETIAQLSNIYSYFGHSPIAPVFFLSLLHHFKRPDTNSFRWCLFFMWLFALLGMSLYGLPEDGRSMPMTSTYSSFPSPCSTAWPSSSSSGPAWLPSVPKPAYGCPLDLSCRRLPPVRLPPGPHAHHRLRARPMAPLCAALHRPPWGEGRLDGTR